MRIGCNDLRTIGSTIQQDRQVSESWNFVAEMLFQRGINAEALGSPQVALELYREAGLMQFEGTADTAFLRTAMESWAVDEFAGMSPKDTLVMLCMPEAMDQYVMISRFYQAVVDYEADHRGEEEEEEEGGGA